jgi:hypothetical protein
VSDVWRQLKQHRRQVIIRDEGAQEHRVARCTGITLRQHDRRSCTTVARQQQAPLTGGCSYVRARLEASAYLVAGKVVGGATTEAHWQQLLRVRQREALGLERRHVHVRLHGAAWQVMAPT